MRKFMISMRRVWRMEVMIRQARTGHWRQKSCIYRKPKPITYSNRAGLVACLPLPLRMQDGGQDGAKDLAKPDQPQMQDAGGRAAIRLIKVEGNSAVPELAGLCHGRAKRRQTSDYCCL
jgi:hypothetical protein